MLTSWKKNINSLYSQYSCSCISVAIEFPYSEAFNTPPGIKSRIVAMLTHWCEGLGMTLFCFKDLVLSRRGNIEDGPLLLVLADIRDSPETQQGIVTVTFAQRKTEINDGNVEELKTPLSAINSIIEMLDDTYSGLPIKLWSICTRCGKEMIPWKGKNTLLSRDPAECFSCHNFSIPPDFLQWPRYEMSSSPFFFIFSSLLLV